MYKSLSATEFANSKNQINIIKNNFIGKKMKTKVNGFGISLKISKIVTAVAVVAISSNLAFSQFAGGNGTSGNPWQITTINHLEIIANNVNSGSTNYQGKFFRLMNDISTPLTKPIGRGGRPFCGTFDGNCKKINLHIDSGFKSPTPKEQIALFGNAFGGATIKNVTVEGTVVGIDMVAGIVALGGDVTIINCTNLATVTVSKCDTFYVGVGGGILGHAWYNATIEGCTNAGNIKGNWLIGGIAGWIATRSKIKNCANIGTIHADGSDAGGIAGRIGYNEDYDVNNSVIIEHCMNAGYVNALYENSGGICGSDWGNHNMIRYCLNVGVVHGRDIADKVNYIPLNAEKGSNSTTGAILGRIHSNANTAVQFCYYDKQMYYDSLKQSNPNGYPYYYTGIGKTPDNLYVAFGYNTAEIIGPSLTNQLAKANNLANNNKLDPTYWNYITNAYPTVKNSGACNSCNDLLHYVAGSPLILSKKSKTAFINTVNCVDTIYDGRRYNNLTSISWTAKNGYFGRNPNADTSDVLYASSICGTSTYRKEIPIKIRDTVINNKRQGIWFKTFNQTAEEKEYSFAFTVSEVSPTVTSDNASINVKSTEAGNLAVSIWDITGAKIMDVEEMFMFANIERTIQINNLSSLATGTYYLVVYFDKQVVMRKFIKQ